MLKFSFSGFLLGVNHCERRIWRPAIWVTAISVTALICESIVIERDFVMHGGQNLFKLYIQTVVNSVSHLMLGD